MVVVVRVCLAQDMIDASRMSSTFLGVREGQANHPYCPERFTPV